MRLYGIGYRVARRVIDKYLDYERFKKEHYI